MITRGEVMEVYVEVTFLTNFLIILSSLEMMGILLCKEMSYLQVLKESFLLSFSVLLLYIDSYSWMILIIWLVIFYLLYQKQIFLYSESAVYVSLYWHRQYRVHNVLFLQHRFKQSGLFNLHIHGYHNSGNHSQSYASESHSEIRKVETDG